MCRFLVYKGPPMLMADLLTRSSQSLIHQSFRARERAEPLNGDGFGVGWYAPDDPEPAVITAITPAWSNRNLHSLAEKIVSGTIFAHVRAASPGLPVTELNCHPFRHGGTLWMHNGWIPDFARVKRRLRESLSDEHYEVVQGTTDSEHAYALFLDRYLGTPARGLEAIETAMAATIARLDRWKQDAGIDRPAYYNFAFTDGDRIVVSRYVDDPGQRPETLYFASGDRFACRDGRYRMYPAAGKPRAFIIASEPLTEHAEDWQAVPANHLVAIDSGMSLRVTALSAHLPDA